MTVHKVGFLLDRLGQDCDPLQYLRELTQNEIEAIQRSGVPEALTTSVMQRYHVYIACRRELGAKFGKLAQA